MSASAQNSRGRTAPHPENPQNAEQWNQMLEHVRKHYEAQISQLVETVRSFGLAIAHNPDGTFTVNREDYVNLPHVHANQAPCSLLCETANGSRVSRPTTQPVSQLSQFDMLQKFRRPQQPAADQPNCSQLQRFNKPQQLNSNQQLDMGQIVTPKPQSSPGLQSEMAQFSTSQPIQFGTLPQFNLNLQSGKGQFHASQPQQFGALQQLSPGPQFGQGPLSVSQPLQFGTLQQCNPDSQSWKGQFSTSRHQQFDKSWQFGADLQTNMGQFNVPQPPQFNSFLEFCMAQQASGIPQALRSGGGQLLSASSQGFGDASIVNVSESEPPLGDMDGLVSRVSRQATTGPPSNCSSCDNWGCYKSRANVNADGLEEISSISTGHNIMRPQD